MRNPPKPAQRPRRAAAEPILRLSRDASGIFKWKAGPDIRPHWKGVSLGRDRKVAEQEARRLNAAVEAWKREQAAPAEAPAAGKRSIPKRQAGPLTVSQLANLWRYGGQDKAGKGSDAWRGLRESTRRQFGFYLKALEAEFGDEVAVLITRARVKDWIDPLKRRAPGSARSYATCGRALFKWAIDTGKVGSDVNPFAALGLKGARKRKRLMTLEDLRHLVRVADGTVSPKGGRGWTPRPSLGTALVFAFACAQRITDVIDWREEHLHREADGSTRLKFDQSKSRKVGQRYELEPGVAIDTRLPPLMARRLTERPEPLRVPSGHLLVNERTREPYTRRNISQAMNIVVKRAIAVDPERWGHLDGLHARDGRRSGFVHMVRVLGIPIERAVNLSGHSLNEGYDIIEHYLPHTSEEADAAAEKMTGEL